MGPVVVLWDGDGVSSPPPGGEQTKTITFCRTSYAGGNNLG